MFYQYIAGVLILLCLINILSAVPAKGAMMKIETTAFQQGKPIPKKFTCQGEDVSPDLAFIDAPEGTKSFALIVDDPDAPNGTFDHWLVWNIPGDSQGLPEGAEVPNQGKNSYGENSFRGPCPPPGKPHRYFFKLYALDATLNLPDGSSKSKLESAMQGHILGKAELMGTFQR